MTTIPFIAIFLILLLCLIILPLTIVLVLDSLVKGHDLPTSKKTTNILIKTIIKYKPKAKNFYDLGCGHGTLSLCLKKSLPELPIYGVDNNRVRIFLAKLKNKILRRKVNFQTQDIFKLDLHDAEIIYTYLWYDLMPILEKKLQKELKPGALVITNTSCFKDWQPTAKIVTHPETTNPTNFETLFLYIKS